MKNNTKITILVTGGTFDKEYNEISGKLYFNESNIKEMLELGRCKIPVSIKNLMLKDSLDMVDIDRKLILDACIQTKIKKIVITHGTDTMTETAKLLAQNIKNKTIVFTGAMIPYKFGASDGLFNLGSALTAAQTLESGVYIAINGNIFKWDEVTKNRKKGVFELI
jgi:L-asparaginase|tara:strand:- start:3169 stop:3666 length:498 start_codon:yes stop_codon:yes gene_type:complete